MGGSWEGLGHRSQDGGARGGGRAASRRAAARERAHPPAGGEEGEGEGGKRARRPKPGAEALRGFRGCGCLRRGDRWRSLHVPDRRAYRSTSVIERSPRGCMGEEPANRAWACQRSARSTDSAPGPARDPRRPPRAQSPDPGRSTPGRPGPGGVRLATKRAFGQRSRRSPGGFTERHGRPSSPAAIYRSVTSRPARRKAPQPPRADDATGSAVTQGHRAKSRETPAPGGGRARPVRALARLPTGPQFGPVVDLPYTRCRAPW